MYIPEATPETLARAARELGPAPDDVLLTLVAGPGDLALQPLQQAVVGHGAPVVGGRFPALIHDGELRDRGAILRTLPALAEPTLVRGLDDDRFRLEQLTGILDRMEDRPYTALILVDGLAPGGARLLTQLHDQFGNSVNYFGGGTGTDDLSPAPTVFSDTGCHRNAAIIAFLALDSQLGSAHGWERATTPMLATRTDGTVVQEINWRPALDVYRETLATMGHDVDPANIWSTGMKFPLGLRRDDGSHLVRSPLRATDGGGLVCAGDIRENTVITILRGEPDALLDAARTAADGSTGCTPATQCALVVDCIARMNFLSDRFAEELAVVNGIVSGNGAPGPEGVISVGEICSTGDGIVELLNKTVATGRLHA
ncbi:MAG: hypothetical protein HKN12_04245 [Gemmatimonadetes bacterium]|nr:hypothetical protein [Gemmatimonadota bacterium]